MRPIKDHVLVRPFASDSMTMGGIIVPDSVKEISNKVQVIAVGAGTKNNPMRFKEGDIAFRVKDSGEQIEVNGEVHFLLPQGYLIATLNQS